MITLLALLQQPANTNQPHGQLESAMFWVGVMFAFLPMLIIAGLVGFVYWNKRALKAEQSLPPTDTSGPS